VAVRSVGAGGGSIAWIDDGGALKVGPRSAGARPGPAAYGHGGVEATVTDAQVVLGRLGRTLCGGTVALDANAARAAVERLAQPLGIPAAAAALAIVEVAEAALVRAARLAALGETPDLLISYGGAAGLHAVAIARALGIGRVLVPVAPGLQCALGALGAEVVIEELCAWSRPLDAAARARLLALRTSVDAALDRDGVVERRITEVVRARYLGQGIDGELELPVEGFGDERFHRAHEAAYGHRLDRAVEVVSLRVRGASVASHVVPVQPSAIGWARVGTRELVDGGEVVRAAIYARERLRAGQRVRGPSIVQEASATLYLPAGAVATRLRGGELLVEVG
jgi:N-methylhydantoinase A